MGVGAWLVGQWCRHDILVGVSCAQTTPKGVTRAERVLLNSDSDSPTSPFLLHKHHSCLPPSSSVLCTCSRDKIKKKCTKIKKNAACSTKPSGKIHLSVYRLSPSQHLHFSSSHSYSTLTLQKLHLNSPTYKHLSPITIATAITISKLSPPLAHSSLSLSHLALTVPIQTFHIMPPVILHRSINIPKSPNFMYCSSNPTYNTYIVQHIKTYQSINSYSDPFHPIFYSYRLYTQFTLPAEGLPFAISSHSPFLLSPSNLQTPYFRSQPYK